MRPHLRALTRSTAHHFVRPPQLKPSSPPSTSPLAVPSTASCSRWYSCSRCCRGNTLSYAHTTAESPQVVSARKRRTSSRSAYSTYSESCDRESHDTSRLPLPPPLPYSPDSVPFKRHMDALRMSLSMDPNDSWRTYRALHESLWPDIPNDLFIALIDHQLQAGSAVYQSRIQPLMVFAQKCGMELDQLGLPVLQRVLRVALNIAIADSKQGSRDYRLALLNELWENILQLRGNDLHAVSPDLRQSWLEFQLRSAEFTYLHGKERAQRVQGAVAEAERFIQQDCGEGLGLFLGEILGVRSKAMKPEDWDERIYSLGKGLAQGIEIPQRTIEEVVGRARQCFADHGEIDPVERMMWIVGEVDSTLAGPEADRARSLLNNVAGWIRRAHMFDTPRKRLAHFTKVAKQMNSAPNVSVPQVIRLSLGLLRSIHVDEESHSDERIEASHDSPRSKQIRSIQWTEYQRLRRQQKLREQSEGEQPPAATVTADTERGGTPEASPKQAQQVTSEIDPLWTLDVILIMFERVSIRSAADVHALVAAITGKLLGLLRQPSAVPGNPPEVVFAPTIERFARALFAADLIGHVDDHLVHLVFDMLCSCANISRTSYILARKVYGRARALDHPYTWSDKPTHHTRWRRLFKAALLHRPKAHLQFASRLYADRHVDIGFLFRQDELQMVRAIGASGSHASKYILLERHIKNYVYDNPTRRNGFVIALTKGLTTRKRGRDAWHAFDLTLRLLGDEEVPQPVYDMVMHTLSNTGRVADWKRAISVLDFVPVSHAKLVEYYEMVFRGVTLGPLASQSQPPRMRQETLTTLYDHARERGIRPSPFMIESMARGLTDEGYVEHATKVLHTMLDHERPVTVELGQRVMWAQVREDMLAEAKTLEKRLTMAWRKIDENLEHMVDAEEMHVRWLAEQREEEARKKERGEEEALLEPKTGGLAKSLDSAFARRREDSAPKPTVSEDEDLGPSKKADEKTEEEGPNVASDEQEEKAV